MTGTDALLISGGPGGLISGFNNGFLPISGAGQQNATEASVQTTQEVAATYSFLGLYLREVSSGASTFTFRKNASAGNQAAPTSTASGFYQDTTHTDSAVVTDLVDVSFTSTGLYEVQVFNLMLNAATPYTLFGAQEINNSGEITLTTSAQYIGMIGGAFGTTGTSGAGSRTPIYAAGTGSKFATYVITATAGTATVQVRRNGTSANQVIAISASSTGLFIDATHSDAFVQGAEAELSFISTNASGVLVLSSMSFAGTTSALDVDAGSTGTGSFNASSTTFQPYGSFVGSVTPEVQTQAYAPFAMTAEFLRGTSTTNSATVVSRIGSVTGNLAISPTGVGFFVDPTHTDSVTATSLINAQVTCSGGGWTAANMGISFNDGTVKPVSRGTLFPQSIP